MPESGIIFIYMVTETLTPESQLFDTQRIPSLNTIPFLAGGTNPVIRNKISAPIADTDPVIRTSPPLDAMSNPVINEKRKASDQIALNLDDIKIELLRNVEPRLQENVWSRVSGLAINRLRRSHDGLFTRTDFTEIYAKIGSDLIIQGNLGRIYGLTDYSHNAQ